MVSYSDANLEVTFMLKIVTHFANAEKTFKLFLPF